MKSNIFALMHRNTPVQEVVRELTEEAEIERLLVGVKTALRKMKLSFTHPDRPHELLIPDASKVAGANKPLKVSVIARSHALQLSTCVLQNASDDDIALAFWFEESRVGEATFLMYSKGVGDQLSVAVRIPIPVGKGLRSARKLQALLSEAFRQMAISREKLWAGAWGHTPDGQILN